MTNNDARQVVCEGALSSGFGGTYNFLAFAFHETRWMVGVALWKTIFGLGKLIRANDQVNLHASKSRLIEMIRKNLGFFTLEPVSCRDTSGMLELTPSGIRKTSRLWHFLSFREQDTVFFIVP